MKIVNGCNFDGDYPDEEFVTGIGYLRPTEARAVCAALNAALNGETSPRIFRAVEDDYVLVPGFEP